MPHAVPIEIFNIAKTAVDKAEVKRWLDFLGATEFEIPDDGAITNPALLIALAAKRCYKSFDKKLNPNLARIRSDYAEYLDNILKSGHGSCLEHSVYSFAIENVSRVFCYQEGTEVLTRNGWRTIETLTTADVLLTKNQVSGLCRWSAAKAVHAFDYVGPLHYWQSGHDRSPAVTPDHSMWATPIDTRRCRFLQTDEMIDQYAAKLFCRDLLEKRFAVDHRIKMEVSEDPTNLDIGDFTYDAELLFEWLGFVATDGTLCARTNRVTIVQKKEPQRSRIALLMSRLFGDRFRHYSYPSTDRSDSLVVHDPHLQEWVRRQVGWRKASRDLSPLFRFSRRLLSKFFDGVVGGDGHVHRKNGHVTVYSPTAMLASQYQWLAAVVGHAAVVYEQNEIGKEHTLTTGVKIATKQLAYRISVHRLGTSIYRPQNLRTVDSTGKVYCPETEDGLVYVRHPNGRAVWCGNTGEMNRHRAGWAISEGSMRFIRYSESIPFWMPDSIKGPDVLGEDHIETYFEGIDTPQAELDNYVPCVADLLSEWRDGDPDTSDTGLDAEEMLGLKKEISRFLFKKAFSEQEQCYRWLEQVWADELKPESKFKGKKEITSMMRRIVGMGVATGGVWSGNVRALRHVITMRAAPEAEEEILHVFTRIAKRMRDADPMLFGDFEEVDGKYWVPKYRKV